jgi:hypothetical protein
MYIFFLSFIQFERPVTNRVVYGGPNPPLSNSERRLKDQSTGTSRVASQILLKRNS